MFLVTILIGVFSRLFIHIPNVTALTSLCLLAPSAFSKRDAFLIIATILLLSDLLLHFMLHYPVLGFWTFFNYSGWFATLFAGFLLQKQFTFSRALIFTFLTSVLFWIWTNLGTWFATGMYAPTPSGLLQCYIAGLPFLRNAVIGSLVWTAVLSFAYQRRYKVSSVTI